MVDVGWIRYGCHTFNGLQSGECKMVDIDSVGRSLLLRLRLLLDEIESLDSMSALEVMWQIRTHTCNQAEIPQAIFRVGDRLASVIYIELDACWEVQLDGNEYQFDTFEDVLASIEQCRRALRPVLMSGQKPQSEID